MFVDILKPWWEMTKEAENEIFTFLGPNLIYNFMNM